VRTHKRILNAAVCGALLGAGPAEAVYLDADGLGQALIFPYYTTRPAEGNLFNTYLSVVNTTGDAKAVRIRFREPIAGTAVLDLNVFLSPNDMWSAAVVPAANGGANAITRDASCVLPTGSRQKDGAYAYALVATYYAGDGLGDGIDRLREGYVEMIEMATLTGASAEAVTHNNGVPDDCGQITSATLPDPADLAPPSGGLMGTLTLINVASGEDFTVNAVALARLTDTPFYGVPPDPYPDFNSAEVGTDSQMLVDGKHYSLRWSNGRDAVSSVLMSHRVMNEYVLDRGTASQTDWVVTMPTRRLYSAGEDPFRAAATTQSVNLTLTDREERSLSTDRGCFPMQPCGYPLSLRSVFVIPMVDGVLPPEPPASISRVLGSRSVLPLLAGPMPFQSGWGSLELDESWGWYMQSAAGSTGYDPATGVTESGRFQLAGLPVTGLMVRTFRNGTLSCATGICQGNYGGSFSHRYRRSVTYTGP
jgi:hypothetical protein